LNIYGKPAAYLVKTRPNGGGVPQLYFTKDHFRISNDWEAPVLFNFKTQNGNARAIGIRIVDDSTEGPLSVVGFKVDAKYRSCEAPSLGDCSAASIWQVGGDWQANGSGDALVVHKISNDDSSGAAFVAGATKDSAGIWSSVEDGAAFLGWVDGPKGIGVNVMPLGPTGADDNRTAFKVLDADGPYLKDKDGGTYVLVEKGNKIVNRKYIYFAVGMNGNMYAQNIARLDGHAVFEKEVKLASTNYKGDTSAYACLMPDGMLVRSAEPCR
jgi:hypothetical protein